VQNPELAPLKEAAPKVGLFEETSRFRKQPTLLHSVITIERENAYLPSISLFLKE